MSCKTNIHGNFEVKRNPFQETVCINCEGAGIISNRICNSCNGHGIVLYDTMHHKVVSYEPNEEQLLAMKILGV